MNYVYDTHVQYTVYAKTQIIQTDYQNIASLPDTHCDLQNRIIVNTNYLYSIPMQTMQTESLVEIQCGLQQKVDSLQNDLILLRKECLSWKAAFTEEARKNEINVNELMEVKSSLSAEQKNNEILLSTLQSATEDSLKMKEEVRIDLFFFVICIRTEDVAYINYLYLLFLSTKKEIRYGIGNF